MQRRTCSNRCMPVSPTEALRRVLDAVSPLPTEDCTLGSAHGRILRAHIRADRAMPPFDRVTMDGYALSSAVAKRAEMEGSLTLKVEGDPQMAGMLARSLSGKADDTCMEIMTGAVLPEGADCVIPYEETTRTGNAVTIAADAMKKLFPGTNVHHRASDHTAGAVLVSPGARLSGREIAAAAACGCTSVPVAALPRIALVATGDELVDVALPVAPHQIRRSNDAALRATLIEAGYSRVESHHLRDVPAEIERGLHRMLTECDCVIITGGVSKGRRDHIPATLAALGVTALFHGVSQRPGKPLWFGLSSRRKPVFALPGNPVSCYLCLHHYVLPALDKASGAPPFVPVPVRLASTVAGMERLTSFVPVRTVNDASGVRVAEPVPFNTSGDYTSLLGTDGYVELAPQASPYPAGHVVPFSRWVP